MKLSVLLVLGVLVLCCQAAVLVTNEELGRLLGLNKAWAKPPPQANRWDLQSLTNYGYQGQNVDASKVLADMHSISFVRQTQKLNMRRNRPSYPRISARSDDGLQRVYRNTIRGGNQINFNIHGGVRINGGYNNRENYNVYNRRGGRGGYNGGQDFEYGGQGQGFYGRQQQGYNGEQEFYGRRQQQGYNGEQDYYNQQQQGYNGGQGFYDQQQAYNGGQNFNVRQQQGYNGGQDFYSRGQQQSYNGGQDFYNQQQQQGYNGGQDFYEQQQAYNGGQDFYSRGQQQSYNGGQDLNNWQMQQQQQQQQAYNARTQNYDIGSQNYNTDAYSRTNQGQNYNTGTTSGSATTTSGGINQIYDNNVAGGANTNSNLNVKNGQGADTLVWNQKQYDMQNGLFMVDGKYIPMEQFRAAAQQSNLFSQVKSPELLQSALAGNTNCVMNDYPNTQYKIGNSTLNPGSIIDLRTGSARPPQLSDYDTEDFEFADVEEDEQGLFQVVDQDEEDGQGDEQYLQQDDLVDVQQGAQGDDQEGAQGDDQEYNGQDQDAVDGQDQDYVQENGDQLQEESNQQDNLGDQEPEQDDQSEPEQAQDDDEQ